MTKRAIAIFVSGRGSNARVILENESKHNYQVALILVSKKTSLAIEIAKEFNKPFIVLDRDDFMETESILSILKQHKIDLICLAGFLWKIPDYLIIAYPNKILNIHPSLLPAYGGKGMYGLKVHEAVIANKEIQSGVTIHLVNEEYDKGKILFQKSIQLTPEETPESLAKRILAIEHQNYPKVISTFISTNF